MKNAILFCFVLVLVGAADFKAQSKLVKILKSKSGAHQKTQQNATQAVLTSTNSRPGRSVNYYWDDQSSQWVYSDSSFYAYTLSGNLTSETSRNGTPNSRNIITYDAQGRVTQEVFQSWDGFLNNWQNNARSTNQFNNQGYMTQNIYESFNTVTNQWEIQYGIKNILTYDASNRITDNIYQNYNTTNNAWENGYRETAFTFDANNNILSLESKVPNGANWDNDCKYTFVYSLNNAPVQLTMQLWNGTSYDNGSRWINLVFHNWCGWYCDNVAIQSGTVQTWGTPQSNQWNNSERINAVYDPLGGYIETWESFTGATWENATRYSRSFNSNLNYTGSKNESWNTINNAWETDFQEKLIYSYDASFNIVQIIWQLWDNTNSVLVNQQKKVYANFTYVGINENYIQTGSLSIFPNPCSGECRIENAEGVLDSSTDYQFKIFDAQGKLVHSEPLSGSSLKFSTNGITPGIYFYHLLNTTGQIKTGKLIVN
ncbi:MAG: T9SS type A sorting domain-containing protein [Bacteroidia bacterium]|nr:T9SS type A sorting domain-containing protein [Bacteroidia bacterium]